MHPGQHSVRGSHVGAVIPELGGIPVEISVLALKKPRLFREIEQLEAVHTDV